MAYTYLTVFTWGTYNLWQGFEVSTFINLEKVRITNAMAPEPTPSSPYLQEPATSPYPEPIGSTPYSLSQSLL
jgi:hypothetical protein